MPRNPLLVDPIEILDREDLINLVIRNLHIGQIQNLLGLSQRIIIVMLLEYFSPFAKEK